MARPIKKGLDYFPVDTDIFENIQVRKLKSRYKSLGFLAYFTILCDVYKKEGYFLHISDDYVYDLADRLGDTEEKIQERYILVVKRCKNPISEEFNCINIVENAVNVSETGVSVTEMRQRKEKESKVNKSKVNKNNACSTTSIERFEYFWCCYPLDKNRYLAERAYISVVSDGIYTEDDLVESAKNYSEYCKIAGNNKIYHADNFLKKCVFEDYLPGKYKKPNRKKHNISFNDFPQREYDFEELEKRLLSNNPK